MSSGTTTSARLKIGVSSAHLLFRFKAPLALKLPTHAGPSMAHDLHADRLGFKKQQIISPIHSMDNAVQTNIWPQEDKADELNILAGDLMEAAGARSLSKVHFLNECGLLHRDSPLQGESTLMTCIHGGLLLFLWTLSCGTEPGTRFGLLGSWRIVPSYYNRTSSTRFSRCGPLAL